ncbi:hypothetical protein KsCSTR_01190 [Candidatus Kuenenia stuttgartiensis]|uniref:Uncharacterized protein n=1 Tax=Kuenenia stuttgartiensis TaxID=174633 RepID=A0A6G7GIU2_KUEST|nr:hypothetical protein [Candidatus Kuenenia stuttgartiensis]QII09498.1 hypothetical protein KsCSTR_01190 [Candidatus Kuenenia stuttgartiensis]
MTNYTCLPGGRSERTGLIAYLYYYQRQGLSACLCNSGQASPLSNRVDQMASNPYGLRDGELSISQCKSNRLKPEGLSYIGRLSILYLWKGKGEKKEVEP